MHSLALAPGRRARCARVWVSRLVLVCIILLSAAPSGAAEPVGPRTVDQLAETLRTDPVLVDPVLGTGDAAGVHDVLTDLADDVDVPVYVVLASLPPDLRGAEDPAQQAAALLRTTLGDGLYVVQFTDGISWVGGFGAAQGLDVGPGQRAYNRARDLGPLDYNQTTAALEAELVLRSAARPGREVSDAQLRQWIDTPRAFVPTAARDRVDQVARRWVFAIAAALAVLIAGLTVIAVGTKWPMGARRARRDGAQTPETIVVDESTLPRAQRRYDKLSVADLASPHATAASDALAAADLVAGTGDRLDAVGAWVLAKQADRELDRIHRSTRQPYRPCVVNPLHGEASATVPLSGSSIDAPACVSCSRERGAFLTASTWRGERPYLDTSTVWARTGFGALVDDLARQVIADRSRR